MSSLFDASGISGILLAALAATFCGAEHWRWLFWIGGLSGIFGFFIRKEMLKNIPKRKTQWKWDWRDWKIIAVIAIVSGFSYTNYYLLSSFLNGFLPLVSRVTTQEALALNSFLLIVDLLLLPFFGWLSLKVEKERLMLGATIAGACLALPLFLMLEGANAWIAGSIRIAFTVIGVCLAAPYHAWAMEMAPQERRFTVCAIGSALGGRLIGAPMPALGLWLYHKTGWAASPALPLLVISLLATAAIAFLKVTRFSSEELAKS